MKPTSAPTTPEPQRYVLGFMFDRDFHLVALIRKKQPAWQAGRLNGVGGKIEGNEPPRFAMVREFQEETGMETEPEDWTHFLTMKGVEPEATQIGGSFVVECFAMIGQPFDLRTTTEEAIELISVQGIYPLRRDMIENLPWCIGLAIDALQDGRPMRVTAEYPV